MDIVAHLSALAHAGRLDIFRLLMRRAPDGVPAGEIAQVLELRQNTCSGHLKTLHGAGLITAARDGTTIRYAAAMGAAQGLMDTLFADCCRGRIDLCLPSAGAQSVLFLCTGNSARSLMAESLLTHHSRGRLHAMSAGIAPAAAADARALQLLAARGLPTQGLHPKAPEATAGDAPNIVLTLCDRAANEDCPHWPGLPATAHWGMPDPAQGDASAFAICFDTLDRRIRALSTLPLADMDRPTLQRALDDIARL